MSTPSYLSATATVALMACSAVVGYWIGVGKSLGITRGSSEDDEPRTDGDTREAASRNGLPASLDAESSDSETEQLENLAEVKASLLDDQAKIALKADSEEDLLVLQAQAQSLNICARSIQDA
ncbi:hypothetical protein EMMF5_003114 [Cystobasidiomycetes sp. EMM_F5]